MVKYHIIMGLYSIEDPMQLYYNFIVGYPAQIIV